MHNICQQKLLCNAKGKKFEWKPNICLFVSICICVICVVLSLSLCFAAYFQFLFNYRTICGILSHLLIICILLFVLFSLFFFDGVCVSLDICAKKPVANYPVCQGNKTHSKILYSKHISSSHRIAIWFLCWKIVSYFRGTEFIESRQQGSILTR